MTCTGEDLKRMTPAAASVIRGVEAIAQDTNPRDITGLLSSGTGLLKEKVELENIEGFQQYSRNNKGFFQHRVNIKCWVVPPEEFFTRSSAKSTENV